MEIVVCPLHLAPRVAAERKVSHAISLLDPPGAFPNLHPLSTDAHLKIGMHDIDDLITGFTHPEAHHVEALLSFAEAWDKKAPLLVHCWAGISRSTASAFAIACAANPDAREMDIALTLRAASPTASPNRRIITIADEMLGRKGRMLSAIEAIGRGRLAEWAQPFAIPARYTSAGEP